MVEGPKAEKCILSWMVFTVYLKKCAGTKKCTLEIFRLAYEVNISETIRIIREFLRTELWQNYETKGFV